MRQMHCSYVKCEFYSLILSDTVLSWGNFVEKCVNSMGGWMKWWKWWQWCWFCRCQQKEKNERSATFVFVVAASTRPIGSYFNYSAEYFKTHTWNILCNIAAPSGCYFIETRNARTILHCTKQSDPGQIVFLPQNFDGVTLTLWCNQNILMGGRPLSVAGPTYTRVKWPEGPRRAQSS